jgi:hypothetical protein
MVARKNVCIRLLGGGLRSYEVCFGRFLSNAKVTVERVIESWSDQTRTAVCGRHVLALQDTSEIKFATTETDRRGLGKIKKGNVFGVLLHPMLAIDAEHGICLGLVSGTIWTRDGAVKLAHNKRCLEEKESRRWVQTAQTAQEILAQAAMITVIGDREADFYGAWARVPGDKVHLLSRLMSDHALWDGGTVRQAVGLVDVADRQTIALRERAGRKPRNAKLALRFGSVRLKRPHTAEKQLAENVTVSFVEVQETDPPKSVEPLHWLLLTTHKVGTAAEAWQIVNWYKQRWIIEQFFRVLKTQGLRIEDSQLQRADRLIKLVAIAAKAAAVIMQLVQARDGKDHQPAELAFSSNEINALGALNKTREGKTALQKNPHPPGTLAWAAWIVAKLGGWDGYKSSKPPGPITFFNGLEYFRAFAHGWMFRDVCMP